MREILSEEILEEHGDFKRVRRWWRGKHPEKGILLHPDQTLTGDWETREEKSVVRPKKQFNVKRKINTRRTK